MSRFAIAAALVLYSVQAGAASDSKPNASRSVEIQQVVRMAGDTSVPNSKVFSSAADLQLGLSWEPNTYPTQSQAETGQEPPQLSLVPIDLVLAQFISSSDRGLHDTLRAAQNADNPQVVMLERGTATLSQLARMVEQSNFASAITRNAKDIVAHLPIAVWQDATLVIESGDRLVLDRAAGAFLLNAGRLIASGATITGSEVANPRQENFRPFVLVALSGNAEIEAVRFEDLGFPQHSATTGVSFTKGGLYPTRAPSFIRDSAFRRTGSLTILNAQSMKVQNNRFIALEGPAILVHGGHELELAQNVVAGTRNSHGIKITSGADNVTLTGNVIVDSNSNGVFVDAQTSNLSLQGNLIAANRKTAIGIVESACTTITGNALVGNVQKGVSLALSPNAMISGNVIAGNGGAGIAISEQPSEGTTALRQNTFLDNQVGISGVSSATIDFDGNDFKGQTPRLLAGELVQYTSLLLKSISENRNQISFADPNGGARDQQFSRPESCRPRSG
jgi:poly(beta-D-mannuronate) C5 epimerase